MMQVAPFSDRSLCPKYTHFLEVAENTGAFAIPLFTFSPNANVFYIQETGRDGSIIDFIPFNCCGVEPKCAGSPRQSFIAGYPIYVYISSKGEVIEGKINEISDFLVEDIPNLDDNPFTALSLSELCEDVYLTTYLRRECLKYLKVHSSDADAARWRNSEIRLHFKDFICSQVGLNAFASSYRMEIKNHACRIDIADEFCHVILENYLLKTKEFGLFRQLLEDFWISYLSIGNSIKLNFQDNSGPFNINQNDKDISRLITVVSVCVEQNLFDEAIQIIEYEIVPRLFDVTAYDSLHYSYRNSASQSEIEVYFWLGAAYEGLGETAMALDAYNTSVTQLRNSEGALGLNIKCVEFGVRALIAISHIKFNNRLFQEALMLLMEAQNYADLGVSPDLGAVVSNNLGLATLEMGEPHGARNFFMKALDLCGEHGIYAKRTRKAIHQNLDLVAELP